MLLLAIRNLLADPVRTAATGLALAAVIAVIIVLEGFRGGLLLQLRQLVLARGGDLIVAQSGISNMIATRSVLPQFARMEVESVAGVKAAHPLTGIPIIFQSEALRTPVFLLVYDTQGGPDRILEGTAWQVPKDIVVDRSLAKKHALQVGDPFLVSDFEFRISGIVQGNAAFFTPIAYIKFDDLIDFYFDSNLASDISTFPLLSFLLVELDRAADIHQVKQTIADAVPNIEVVLPEQLAGNDEKLGRILFGPIMNLLIVVSYIIGALVTSIILFSAINARRREFGLLVALGFDLPFLCKALVLESLVMLLIAIPLGIFMGATLGWLVEHSMPLYLLPTMESLPLIRTTTASIGFSLLGALIPLRLIRGLDPAIVFRA